MAKRAAVSDQGILDPMFPIPEGLKEFTYTDPDDYLIGVPADVESDEYTYNELDDTEEIDDDSYIVDDDVDYSDRPDVPDELNVVEQIIRTLDDGTQVVDLIVDVTDVPGAQRYEFRVVLS